MSQSYIMKAKPEEILCHGTKCTIRDRCLRYNLEPNKDQKWFHGLPFNVAGVTVECDDFKGITKEEAHSG